MAALAVAAQASDYPAKIALVVSNIPEAAGLNKAKELGIETMVINHKTYASRRKFERVLDTTLSNANIELVCCAGFMRVLTPWFVKRWEGRLINIHPSLLPKYKGLNTHQRALEAGDKQHGCTVHYITAELDAGETILQHLIDIQTSDTEETLAVRLLPYEQKLYPKALAKVAMELQAIES